MAIQGIRDLKAGFNTNDCLKLRVAACYPFGKTSCFSQNGRAV
jgi:hypothetical protein